MTEEQWSQVESYFDELRDRSPNEIAAGLAAIAGEAVRAEVGSLLLHTGGGETVGLAIGAMATRQSLNAARKLWDEFPDQNEFVRRRQAELREKNDGKMISPP